LKQTNIDLSVLSGAQHLAGSGRTSFPVDKALPRDAYRVLGYRQCGERAVRVDILERLADLIRPALAWREASPGAKPAGAFDGRSFVVTQAMTSLTGSAGEDFASILRALGYRMERRPQPTPKPAVVETPPAGEAAPAEISSATTTSSEATAASEGTVEPVTEATVIETTASETAVAADAVASPEAAEPPAAAEVAVVSSRSLLPQVDFAQTRDILDVATVAEEAKVAAAKPASTEAAPDVPVEPGSAEAAPETAAATDAAPAEAAAVAATPAEPELVEVWRPGGRSDERRPPRHDRKGHHRRHDRAAQGAASPAAGGEAAAGEAGEAAKREQHRHGRRDRHRDFRKNRPDQPAEAAVAATAEGAPASEGREERHGRPRDRVEGKGREDRNRGKFRDREDGNREGGRDKGRERGRDRGRESGPSHRQYASSASPRERDRPVDPNSPFAKLAALKEQMTAGRKD
jgi:ATP-dependent RNA helicase SUPV3L1/SUV3